jgi:DNA replication factor GINS
MSKSSEQLSYEDLGTIYRTEKKSPTISSVRRDLYPAMADLIIRIRLEYERHLSADPDSIICEGVNQRRKKALSMSREITELRMSKIATLALMGARGGQNVLDHLTSEEREYYENVLGISRKHVEIVDKLSGKRKYETPAIDPEPVVVKKPSEPIEVKKAADPVVTKKAGEPVKKEVPAADTVREEAVRPDSKGVSEEKAAVPQDSEEEDEMVVIRILEDLPPFSGPDRNYELSKEDVVRMPKAMAEALINRKKALVISPGP